METLLSNVTLVEDNQNIQTDKIEEEILLIFGTAVSLDEKTLQYERDIEMEIARVFQLGNTDIIHSRSSIKHKKEPFSLKLNKELNEVKKTVGLMQEINVEVKDEIKKDEDTNIEEVMRVKPEKNMISITSISNISDIVDAIISKQIKSKSEFELAIKEKWKFTKGMDFSSIKRFVKVSKIINHNTNIVSYNKHYLGKQLEKTLEIIK